MKIKVYHSAFEDQAVHIATVTAPHAVVEEALEYAYRWTQNIMDSWSHPDGVADKCSNVEVVEPLKNGYGHRSTSVGDYCEIDGELWRVAGMGFEKANKIATRQPL
jgi:hypothetical protein